MPLWHLACILNKVRTPGALHLAGKAAWQVQGACAYKATATVTPPEHTKVVEFAITDTEAVDVFKRHQEEKCHRLHATNVVQPEERPHGLYLPFWLFQVTASAECKGTLGYRVDKSDSKSPLSWTPMSEWKQFAHQKTFSADDPAMQVYASYHLRRDLAEAAKLGASALESARPLTQQELQLVSEQLAKQATATAGDAEAAADAAEDGKEPGKGHATPAYEGSSRASSSEVSRSSDGGPGSTSRESSSSSSRSGGGPPVIEPPEMRRCIAWLLCYRRLKLLLVQEGLMWLKANLAADDVKDLRVRVKLDSRRSFLAFFPAYYFSYSYGVKYTPSRAEIVPQHFEALVGGTRGGQVAAELHPSPAKAQLASAAVIVASMGMGAQLLVGLDAGVSLGLVDAAFAAFLGANAAGAFAKAVPRVARNQHMANQVRLEKEFYRQYDQRESAAHEPPDAHTLWLWLDQDWRRWEGDDPWNWDPLARRQWAEDLMRQQASRAREKDRFHTRQQQQKEQQEADEESDRQRQQKYGRSRPFTSHGHREAGHSSHAAPKRRRDFLGYYKIMNMDPEGELSTDLIKQAFKKAALQLHPDRQMAADEAQQRQASERFRRLQVAYEVLRDPKRRKAYDAGRLVQ